MQESPTLMEHHLNRMHRRQEHGTENCELLIYLSKAKASNGLWGARTNILLE